MAAQPRETCASRGPLLRGFRKQLGRFGAALRGRPRQPCASLLHVNGNAAAGKIHLGEIELRVGMALLGGGLHPSERRRVVLRHAAAGPVERGQLILRLHVAPEGPLLEEFGRVVEVPRTQCRFDLGGGRALPNFLRKTSVPGSPRGEARSRRLCGMLRCSHAVPYLVSTSMPTLLRNAVGRMPPAQTMTASFRSDSCRPSHSI